jgi:hypothetical protein
MPFLIRRLMIQRLRYYLILALLIATIIFVLK